VPQHEAEGVVKVSAADKTCSHSVCSAGGCHFTLPPASIEHSERQRPLWDIEQSGVCVGQRYRSWQFNHVCRIVALGLSTHLGSLEAMVAFEIPEWGLTYFKELSEFTDYIASHKRWELISDSHDEVT
jgi:hypothetical protein